MTGTEEDTYHIELPDFEGPLDLLLHLVKRHELSILEIPIAFITDKYLAYLELMRTLNIDVAGDYLLMAATLAYLKSRELLPRPPALIDDEADAEDGADPRLELVRRLLEYQRYKEAALQLGERPVLGRQVFPRGAPVERPPTVELPLVEVGTFELLAAFAEVLGRQRVETGYEVMIERISISDRINEIVDLLQQRDSVRLLDCIDLAGSGAQLRHRIVVTFLAMLEMARLRMIRVLQERTGGEIYLTRTASLQPAAAAAQTETTQTETTQTETTQIETTQTETTQIETTQIETTQIETTQPREPADERNEERNEEQG
ncbi:MAG: segregation/condensation protein A [Proteobacteria bacterium]|nr:segregation/condensation protein A [Pseudomonadota bacterium]